VRLSAFHRVYYAYAFLFDFIFAYAVYTALIAPVSVLAGGLDRHSSGLWLGGSGHGALRAVADCAAEAG
jgi:hypothetical protein